jgi:hypothetical protein
MPRPEATEDDKTIETWETSIAGTVFVWVYDRREDRYQQQSVGGSTGSRRIHLTRDDRKYNQELVPSENQGLDPFTNGTLRLIGAATRDEMLDTRYHFTDDELGEMFEVRDVDLFLEACRDITSELILRRLLAMADVRGTVAQAEGLKDLVKDRYPIGGTQKTIRDMIEAGEKIGATRSY